MRLTAFSASRILQVSRLRAALRVRIRNGIGDDVRRFQLKFKLKRILLGLLGGRWNKHICVFVIPRLRGEVRLVLVNISFRTHRARVPSLLATRGRTTTMLDPREWYFYSFGTARDSARRMSATERHARTRFIIHKSSLD